MWEEGQISEFGMYGSGITNYFKFLKWLYWTFAILTVIALPALVLNVYGVNTTALSQVEVVVDIIEIMICVPIKTIYR